MKLSTTYFWLQNILLALFIAAGVLIPLVMPQLVAAQAPTGFLNCTGTDCSACNLVYTANRVIVWLIGILFIVFAILIVRAGFGLVVSGGNPSAMTAAKSSMINALIGLLILLSAWILIDTLLRGLGVQNLARTGPLPWSEVQCQVQTVPDANRYEVPAAANVQPQFAGQAGDPANLTQAQQLLQAAGVSTQGGVRLEGVSSARLEEIARLSNECAAAMGRSCGIQVSSGVRVAGNPAGVGAHGTGQALDLSSRNSPVFNEWMRQQTSYPQVRSFGTFSGYQVSPSTVCTWEGPDGDANQAHWHCAPPTR